MTQPKLGPARQVIRALILLAFVGFGAMLGARIIAGCASTPQKQTNAVLVPDSSPRLAACRGPETVGSFNTGRELKAYRCEIMGFICLVFVHGRNIDTECR